MLRRIWLNPHTQPVTLAQKVLPLGRSPLGSLSPGGDALVAVLLDVFPLVLRVGKQCVPNSLDIGLKLWIGLGNLGM